MPIAIHLQPNTRPSDSEINTALYSPLLVARSPEAVSTWQITARQEANLMKEALESWERFKKKYGAELGLEGFDSAQPDKEPAQPDS